MVVIDSMIDRLKQSIEALSPPTMTPLVPFDDLR